MNDKRKIIAIFIIVAIVAALAADSPLHHFTVHRLLADNVGAVVS